MGCVGNGGPPATGGGFVPTITIPVGPPGGATPTGSRLPTGGCAAAKDGVFGRGTPGSCGDILCLFFSGGESPLGENSP
jgi:hypothetical protein